MLAFRLGKHNPVASPRICQARPFSAEKFPFPLSSPSFTKCISDNGNPLFDTSERHDIDEDGDAESAGESIAS
jgi:hypothetical protein